MHQLIHTALIGAMRDISRIGIGKTKSANAGGANYKFRGVEDAMNEMSPILVNNGITVTPRYSELNVTERAKGEPGKFTRFVTIKASLTFSAEDGSSVTAEAYGEAMDSGDKATIKAESVAYRTVLFQQFIVPTMAMDTEIDDQAEEPAQPPKQAISDERFTRALAAIVAGTTTPEYLVSRFALTEVQELALDAARGGA